MGAGIGHRPAAVTNPYKPRDVLTEHGDYQGIIIEDSMPMLSRAWFARFLLGASALAMLGCISAACAFG